MRRGGTSPSARLRRAPPLSGEAWSDVYPPPYAYAHDGGCLHAACPRRLCQPPWTHSTPTEIRPTRRRNQLRRNAHPKRQPLFGRRGLGRRGKDSHSRQWRLSMAAFLNRNKRPLAAPIEVAELLSEKPPPPQNLAPHKSLREGARGRSFSQRSCLPRITPHVPFPCSYFLSFYFYFVAEFIRTICTQALPNDCFCRTIGARSKRGGYLG